MVCYNEKTQIKTRKGCRTQGQHTIFQFPSPSGALDSASFFQQHCVNLHGILTTREAHLSLGVQSFTGSWLCRYNWLPRRLALVSSSCGAWAHIEWPTISHRINTDHLEWPKPPQVNLRHRDHLLEAEDKDQNSLWVRLIAYCKFLWFNNSTHESYKSLFNHWLSKQLLNIYYRPSSLLYPSWYLDLRFSSLYFILFLYFACSLVFELFHRLSENILLMVLLERRLPQLASHTEFCWH